LFTGDEPVIGHLKQDHRMGRNFLAHSEGDANNAVLAAVGYNLYGAMIVKVGSWFVSSSPGSANWRPSPRPDLLRTGRRVAGTVKGGPQAHRAASRAPSAPLLGRVNPFLGGQTVDDRFRGELAEPGAEVARQTCMR